MPESDACVALAPPLDGLSGLRLWAQTWLDQHGLGPEDYDVLVVMTELVTNAIRYAPGSVEVELTAGPGAIVLSVTDSSDDPPRKRAADIHGGRGLIVIEQLANRWGVRFLPGGGKTVWCQFDLPLSLWRTPPESRGAVRASPKEHAQRCRYRANAWRLTWPPWNRPLVD